ncbi:MAG TPA: hypothetical protein VJ023_21675 [Pyrinomonadaceae bacterium]|nr:hypothetical protein [Pyrinomonadaceae bacterium]
MATAEKVFQLNHALSSTGVPVSPAGFLMRVFGCWHRELSRPFTRHGQTYRTCVNCGARRRFDLKTWETKGGFYRTVEDHRIL